MDQDETTDINMRLFGLDPEAIGDIVLRALDDSSQPKDMQHIADPDDKYLHSPPTSTCAFSDSTLRR